MDVDELGRGRKPSELEPEVERRPDDADHIGVGQGPTTGMLEEERMLGRQRTATGTVEVDGQAAVLSEDAELLPGAVPPDACPCDHRRTLGLGEQVGGLHHLARIAEGARVRARALGNAGAVRKEHIHGELEVDRPARLRERVSERGRDVIGDAIRLGADGGPLRDRRQDRALVELLQCALARLSERPGATDHDERRLG